jgi:hypothetical protein
MQRSLGETRGRFRGRPGGSVSPRDQAFPQGQVEAEAGGGISPRANCNPHAAESGKDSLAIIGHHVHALIEALITF